MHNFNVTFNLLSILFRATQQLTAQRYYLLPASQYQRLITPTPLNVTLVATDFLISLSASLRR